MSFTNEVPSPDARFGLIGCKLIDSGGVNCTGTGRGIGRSMRSEH